MKYHIEISSVAEVEANAAFLRISQITSPQTASQWYAGLLAATNSLTTMPSVVLLHGKMSILVMKFGNFFMVKDGAYTVSSLPY